MYLHHINGIGGSSAHDPCKETSTEECEGGGEEEEEEEEEEVEEDGEGGGE